MIEHTFTIIALIFYTGGPLPVILSGGASESLATEPVDYTLMKLCWIAIYILTAFYLAPHWKQAAYLLVKDKLILSLMIIIFLSILWSVDPGRTFTRMIAIYGTTLFGVYFVTRYSLKQQLYFLAWAFGLASIMSLLFGLVLPTYGIMQGIHEGAWRGIYTHKNVLGGMMAFSSITFLLLSSLERKRRWLFVLGIFISVALLLLSKAISPLIYLSTLTPALLISYIYWWSYKSKALGISLIMAISYAVVMVCISRAEAIASAFGKDLTLTGRTDLWAYVWKLIQAKPWLGYGYGALWSNLSSETTPIWRILGWEAPHSHNGFLEVWLSLGLLGLLVLLTHIAISFIRLIILIARAGNPIYFFPLIILLLTVANNFTENGLIERNAINWILYVSSTLLLQQRLVFKERQFAITQAYTNVI